MGGGALMELCLSASSLASLKSWTDMFDMPLGFATLLPGLQRLWMTDLGAAPI